MGEDEKVASLVSEAEHSVMSEIEITLSHVEL
jgi:hypothetical protein